MSQRRERILVADDDFAARLLMQAALERAGYEVALAEDGQAALAMARSSPWDLVMLDVEMPGLSGYETCTRLRQALGDELPVVMVTGMDDLESVEHAFQSGATDFIAKPINWALIGHRVRYLLRAYAVLQDLHLAHARNSAILTALPDTLFRLDDSGVVQEVRPAAQVEDARHLPRAGHALAASLPAEAAARILAAAADTRASGLPQALEFELALDGGGARHYEARLSAINDREALCLVRDITERNAAETALRQSEARLRQAQAVARMGSWQLDLASNILHWSPETYRIFALPEDEPLTFERFLACVHPDDRAALDQAWRDALAGAPYRVEHRILAGDETRWVLEQAELHRDASGTVHSGVGTVLDITERKLRELEIVSTRNKLLATLDAIPDLLFEVDRHGRYLDFRSPDHALLAAPPEQIIGMTIAEVLPPAAAETCLAALAEAEAEGRSSGRQIELPLPQGTRWFELSVSRKEGGDGQPHFIVLSRDISERKEAERRIYRLAYFDTLTGLPNRLAFSERLEREVQRARHHRGKLAVLFLDLDRFKNVNDTLGHGAGDLLLQLVAERLRMGVRPADLVARSDYLDTEIDLARLGGDEFTLLMPQLHQGDNALHLAQRIHELMHRPFILDGREVVVTASIGIAIYPDDGEDSASLLKHADTAMYHAKDQGRDNIKYYSATLTEEAMRRLDLESSLRLALEREELFLVYQPQLDLTSGRILSLEALLRWRHPVRGLIPPLEFIPAAEENGLILPIGEWVLRSACADAMRWLRAGRPLRVAVNLSALQFRDPHLLDQIGAALKETGLPPEWLELEVTEGALMEDSAATLATLNALRGLGLQLSLDDFGTGYSSLSYLKRLPLNNLKVDQSFVRGLPDDRESLAIVRAIVALAKNLGFTVTAEGIETGEQARLLQGMACECLQGYYIGRPVPAAEVPALLGRHWDTADGLDAGPVPVG